MTFENDIKGGMSGVDRAWDIVSEGGKVVVYKDAKDLFGLCISHFLPPADEETVKKIKSRRKDQYFKKFLSCICVGI